jgi:hypothetical protein
MAFSALFDIHSFSSMFLLGRCASIWRTLIVLIDLHASLDIRGLDAALSNSLYLYYGIFKFSASFSSLISVARFSA